MEQMHQSRRCRQRPRRHLPPGRPGPPGHEASKKSRANSLTHGPSLHRIHRLAEVAELADAHGSGPCGGNPVEVRVLSSAPTHIPSFITPPMNASAPGNLEPVPSVGGISFSSVQSPDSIPVMSRGIASRPKSGFPSPNFDDFSMLEASAPAKIAALARRRAGPDGNLRACYWPFAAPGSH